MSYPQGIFIFNQRELGTMDIESIGTYLYRRQYILGPRTVELPGIWKTTQISDDYILTFHQDLPVTSICSQNKSIHLLGYVIDSKNPSFDDKQIVKSIIEKSKTADDVFGNLADKCGRYVVIIKFGDEFRIFSDSCGLRPVFFYQDNDDKIWCASQPHLIAKALGLQMNEDIRRQLYSKPLFRGGEYWFPGTVTLFDGVLHLLPNHYLNVHSGKVIRYWPRTKLEPLSVSECIPTLSEILSNIIEGASYRFNLAFAISCGFDSRTLFSCSRKVANKIRYFSFSPIYPRNTFYDASIPARMAHDLGLRHDIIFLPSSIDKSFIDVFQKSVFPARKKKLLNAWAFYDHFKKENQDFLVISGDFSDITKRSRVRFPKTPKFLINGSTLAAMARMPSIKIATEEFSKWLSSVKSLDKFNINILDLMHWEQRMANWGAQTLCEYDIIHESLCPFTCRSYIEYMLRVPFKYRTNPDYKLHHEIILANWPEVLNYDINPANNKIRKTFENVLYMTNLFDPLQFLYIMLIKRYKTSDL